MIRFDDDDLMTIPEAAQLLDMHVSNVRRWVYGIQVGGQVVKLETLLIGAKNRVTNRQSIQEFFQALTAAKDAKHATPKIRAEQQKQRDITAATNTLAQAGFFSSKRKSTATQEPSEAGTAPVTRMPAAQCR